METPYEHPPSPSWKPLRNIHLHHHGNPLKTSTITILETLKDSTLLNIFNCELFVHAVLDPKCTFSNLFFGTKSSIKFSMFRMLCEGGGWNSHLSPILFAECTSTGLTLAGKPITIGRNSSTAGSPRMRSYWDRAKDTLWSLAKTSRRKVLLLGQGHPFR